MDDLPHLLGCAHPIEEPPFIACLHLSIDTVRHRYLPDHVFGDRCFVPAAVIVEIACEASVWFGRALGVSIPHALPLIVRDFRVERALAMPPGGAIEVRIGLRSIEEKGDGAAMRLELVSKRITKGGKVLGDRFNAAATVELGADLAAVPAVDLDELPDARAYEIPIATFYSSFFPSLGPQFQAAQGVLRQGAEALSGLYDCRGLEQGFIDAQQAPFLTSPLGHDACLQYSVLLSRMLALTGRLPVGADEIRFHQPHPASGPMLAMIHCTHLDEELAVTDLVAWNEARQVVLSASGYQFRKSPYHGRLDRQAFDALLSPYCVEPLRGAMT